VAEAKSGESTLGTTCLSESLAKEGLRETEGLVVFPGEEKVSGEAVWRVPSEDTQDNASGHSNWTEKRIMGPVLSAFLIFCVVFLITKRDGDRACLAGKIRMVW